MIVRWIRWDRKLNRVYVGSQRQRIHHGPVGLSVGFVMVALRQYPMAACLCAWGLTDLHDIPVWFARGPGT